MTAPSQDLNQAIKLNPAYTQALFARGMAYRAKGEPDRAVPDFDAVIKLTPRDAAAFFNRGLAYKDLRDYDRAMQDLRPALQHRSELQLGAQSSRPDLFH